jgi:hypothetical protein
MTLVLTFSERGTATVIESDGVHVALDATFSSPPGSTLSGTLEGTMYQVKVRSSRKQESDGHFRIEGKWVSLTKATREKIVLKPQA